MIEQDKRKLDLPWATLLPVIAALAGIIAQYKPLVSSRPATAGEKTVEINAEQDVDARLWQDPIAVAQRQKELLRAASGIDSSIETPRHNIKQLAQLIRATVKKEMPDRVLLLCVMLDAGPYIEQSESRLRSRQAVLAGLSESGFVPSDSEHIGFVTSKWPLDEKATSGELLLPWEQCISVDYRDRVYPRGTRRVFVLWLPSPNFSDSPLTRLATLLTAITNGDDDSGNKWSVRDDVDVSLIGPVNSNGLQHIVEEVRSWELTASIVQETGQSEALHQMVLDREDALEGVKIVSPRATLSDEALTYDPSREILDVPARETSLTKTGQQTIDIRGSGAVDLYASPTINRFINPLPTHPPTDEIERAISPQPRGLRFIRTITTDDVVLAKLIRELKRRQIDIERDVSWEAAETGDQAVILTEWDSAYGRSLATTFAALASHQSYALVAEKETQWPSWIHAFRYLRGIDGRVPGDLVKVGKSENKDKNQRVLRPMLEEAAEGVDQSDYLRRLARALKVEDLSFQRRRNGRIRAIGLLGSDVYDQLMILRALRPEFPDAVFFTNNYDAHFERRAEWADTHNLVIVSPFGGSLPPRWQSKIAPFRDNLQTSMYMGTLVATGKISEQEAIEFTKHPKVFEISRYGAYDLSRPWRLSGEPVLPPSQRWFRDWLSAWAVRWHLVIGFSALFAIVVWVSLSVVDRSVPEGGGSWHRLEQGLTSTVFCLIIGVPFIVFFVAWYSQHGHAVDEPLVFFSGISIWPSEILRLLAFLLAVHFMIKAKHAMACNECQISKDFYLKPLTEKERGWANCRLGLARWKREYESWTKDSVLSADEAWHAYLRRNQFWPRLIRVGALSSMYIVFMLSIFTLFPRVSPPARGNLAFNFDTCALILAVVGMIALSFYVFDALQLNSNFIRMFTHSVTKWAPDVSKLSRRDPPLSNEELSRYHGILFVAQRTEAVAPLIWYPLIVLAIMIVARSSFFDNWTWPLSLILVYTCNAMWAFGSAIFLRRAAEQLRSASITNLQLLRASSYNSCTKRRTFDELITEIREVRKGAFAPLSEQHFIRAILVPGGGLGLFAVAQRLLDLS